MIVMIFQEGMGAIRTCYFIFLVVVLCGSLVVSSDYRRTREEEFLCQVVDPATGEIDDNLVKDQTFFQGISFLHNAILYMDSLFIAFLW